MGLSKEQVEKHIAGIQKRLSSAQERAHHGYEFARLCVEVKKYQDAIRYLQDYLSVQEKDFRAHKLMGQACEREGLLEKAIVHYNRSLRLREDQREVAISVARLYCKIENPAPEALKTSLERIEAYSNVHSLVLSLTEKICSIEGGSDPDLATKLAEQQLSRCKDDVAAHIHLVNHYNSSGEVEKALAHCLFQRDKKRFTDSKEWLTCTLHIAENHYAAMRGESVQDYDAQCRVLITVLDHLSLLFHTSSRASGSLMASVLLKYDKVLFAALQSLKAQHPHINPIHRVALRELCGQFYLLLASYMYWSHRFKVSFTASHSVKYAQVGNLCLLAALSFPPPHLDSVPLASGMEQRRELEAWHTRSCSRLCVVSRHLLLVSRGMGDIYLGGLAKIIEGQGGKLAIIKTLFTENDDLRGVKVEFASSPIKYNIRRSYIAAESEHLLAPTPAIPLPSEAEALVCDKIYFLSNGQDLPALLWLCVCLRAMDVTTTSVYQWLPNVFAGLRIDLPGSYINTTAPDTLSLPDVEAILVLSIHTLQTVLTSAPSHPSSLPISLLHTLPITMTTEFQGSDLSKYCQWWSYVHQYISTSASGGSADVKRVISEGLGLVRGCRPLRLNLSQLTCLAKHFQQRAESVLEADESSVGRDKSGSASLIEDLLWRSCHYWEIIVAILTERGRGSKIRRPQVPPEGGGGAILVTSGEPSGVSLLNKAHMALGDAAAYRRDLAKALGLYSKVKTSLAAWNQAQIYLVMAQQGSSGESGETSGELKKMAEECLDLALSRLTATDKDLKEKIEEKQKELKKMMSEDEESRRDIAVSLTYDSSPESSLLIPRKSSTPAASGVRQSHLSPFSPDKKTSSLMDSLREEMKEKDTLITSMNEQLKSLQAEVSALKLYVSPAPGYPSPHLSHSFQHPSPQAMGGGVPHQIMTPSGMAMYPPHPALSSSFRSPLLQSPMGMNVHQQQQIVYHSSPQPQLTPLPPHLSPASNPGLSISGAGSQVFVAQQQLASGVSYRSGGIGASNLQAGGVVQPVLNEQPIVAGQVTAGVGYRFGGTQVSNLQLGTNMFPPGGTTLGELPPSGYVFNEQSILGGGQATNGVGYTTGGVAGSMLHPSGAEQSILAGQATGVGYRPGAIGHQVGLQPGGMLPPVGATLGQQTGNRVPTPSGAVFGQQPMVAVSQMILPNQLSYQMQLLQQGTQQPPLQLVDVQHLTQQPRVPVLTSSEPTSPPSPSPLPTLPDPSTTGFVLKPGTFLPASTEHKSVKTSPSAPPTTQYSPPKSVTTLPATSLPSSAPVTTKPGVGIFDSVVPTPATIGTGIPPFSTSLPLGGGFQFSMRPPLTIKVEPPSTAGVMSETLASLLQSSTPQTTSVDFPATSSFSLSSALNDSIATTTTPVSLSFYAPPTTTAAATLSLGSLGRTTDDSEAEKRSDHESLYDAMPDFKPIVSLPQLEAISTGEEDERVLFANRAKLYRYDGSASAWKERGIGEIKILEHKASGKARVLMRRDQILKLCCNHYITPEMTLAPLQGNNQLAWYTGCDFSDGEPKPEKLAVKFKQALVVAEFRRVFETCIEKAKGHKKESGGDEDSSSPPASAEVSLRERFSAPVGSWECDTCLVQNEASAVKCVACATAKPGLETDAAAGDSGASAAATFAGLKFGGDSKSGVSSFGGPVSLSGSLGTASGGFSMGSLSLGSMLNAKSAGSGGSGHDIVPSATSSNATASSGGFKLGGSLFSASSTSASDSGRFKFTFGASATSTAANSAATADKTRTTSTTSGTEGGGFKFSTTEAKTDAAKTSDTIGKFSFSVPSTTSTAQPPLFGSSGGFKFTLPPVAPTSTGSKTETDPSGSPTEQQEGVLRLEPRSSPPPKTCTAGLDFASLFTTSSTTSSKPFQFSLSLDPPKIPSPTEQEPSDDLNTSAHEPDIHFEPIVSLPEAVEISSGEENEETVFAERAKLFRFDSSVDQWKERGIGEMKILMNRQAGKARVLMRRDQVLKICCNHVIASAMSLTPMQGSNKAWTWFTPGDFSEEAQKPENFAIRFKSPAIATTFKKAFEEAVGSAGTATNITAEVLSQREEKGEGENEQQESGDDSKAAEASSSKAPDFAARFAPTQGSWDCGECYVTNRKEDVKCCACGKSKPGAPQQSSLPTPKPFPFASNSGAPITQSQQGISFFGARLQLTPRLFTRNQSPADEDEANDRSSSSPSPSPSPRLSPRRVSFRQATSTVEPHEDSDDDVVIISVELPSEEKVKFAESLLLPSSFFNYEALPPCPGCRGCIDPLTGHYERASGSEGHSGESSAGTATKLPTAEEGSGNLKEAIEISLKRAVTPEADEQSSVQPHTPPMSPPPLSAADEREPVQPHTPPMPPPPLSAADEREPVQPHTPPMSPPPLSAADEREPVQPHTPPMPPTPLSAADEREPVQPHTPPMSPPPLSAADEREPVQPHTPPMSPPPLSAADEREPVQPHTPPMSPPPLSAADEREPVQPHTPPMSPPPLSAADEREPVQPHTPPMSPPPLSAADEREPVQPHTPPMPPTPLSAADGREPVQPHTPPMSPPPLSAADEREPVQPHTPPMPPTPLSAADEREPVQPHTPPMSPPPLSAADEREPMQPHTPPMPLSAADEREPKLEVHSMFGASSTTSSASLSFADLAGSGAGFLDNKEEGFKFSGVGKKLFTPRDEQDDPEKEVNIHFKPVVTLPESVKVKSWDDDAGVLFSQRAKLYRFDEHRKWKERGRGELKILRHRETGKVKLLMRRDQTLKICCNHSLTPDMIVTLLANDEKACTWFTNADYAEEVVSHEKLCAKFKNVKCREDFMSALERFRCEASEGEGGGEEEEEEEGEGEEGS